MRDGKLRTTKASSVASRRLAQVLVARSKRRFNLLLIIICIVFFLGSVAGLWYLLVRDEPIVYPVDHLTLDGFEVYFAPSNVSLIRFVDLIYSAQSQINCAFRSLNYPPIEEALKFKESTGVKVRLFVDDDYIGNKRIREPYVRFARKDKGFMHNNYCIIDETVVTTGSLILNANTLDHNFHDFVVINSTRLASQFTSDFWRLYENQTVANRTIDDVATVWINPSTSIRAYFCPVDDCRQVFLDAILGANESIRFAIYAFTDPVLIDALKNASARGVIVQGVVERDGIDEFSIITHHLSGIRPDSFNRRIHTKIITIDDAISITGSTNPSISAGTINDENIVVISNRRVADFYDDFITYVFTYRK